MKTYLDNNQCGSVTEASWRNTFDLHILWSALFGLCVDIYRMLFIMFRLGPIIQKCFVAWICCLECSSCEVTHGKLIGNSKPAAKGQPECIRGNMGGGWMGARGFTGSTLRHTQTRKEQHYCSVYACVHALQFYGVCVCLLIAVLEKKPLRNSSPWSWEALVSLSSLPMGSWLPISGLWEK